MITEDSCVESLSKHSLDRMPDDWKSEFQSVWNHGIAARGQSRNLSAQSGMLFNLRRLQQHRQVQGEWQEIRDGDGLQIFKEPDELF